MLTVLRCLAVLLLFLSTELKAASVPPDNIPSPVLNDSNSKNNFFKTPSVYKSHKKGSFLQKLEYKILQKRLKYLVAHPKDKTASGNNVLSTVALVLGILALGLLFIPGVAVGSLIAAPAALITGIIALGKGYDNTKGSRAKAIIGIVLGSIIVAIFLLALALFASGGFTF